MRILDIVNRAFGEADDAEQAQFLNQLGYSLLEACKFDKNKVEEQLCYVSSKLDQHGRGLILKLADFVNLRDEADPSPFSGQEEQ
jgi:hypothetical protein